MGIGYGACQHILIAELDMHCGTTKFVPMFLTADQKHIWEELCQIASDDATFLFRVINCDGSWIYSYDPETKQQSSQWKSPNSPRPKKGKTGEKQSQEHVYHFL
jgi:hypothetical protein